MITTAKSIKNRIYTGLAYILICVYPVFSSVYANTQEPVAQSTTSSTSVSEGYTLVDTGSGVQSRSAETHQLGSFHHQIQARPTIWISDVGTLLFDDLDGDGYHSGFSITIDVDSGFGDTEVYANIYLESSLSASILLHTSDRFSVYGTTVSDEYRIDTELRNNYPTDNYDVSIDIHDAWSGELLTNANGWSFNNLKQLPLESGDMTEFAFGSSLWPDDEYHQPDNHHFGYEGGADVVVTEYGALLHPAILLILAGGLLIRRCKP